MLHNKLRVSSKDCFVLKLSSTNELVESNVIYFEHLWNSRSVYVSVPFRTGNQNLFEKTDFCLLMIDPFPISSRQFGGWTTALIYGPIVRLRDTNVSPHRKHRQLRAAP